MNKQEINHLFKWLVEVWNPNQLRIPFIENAADAYLNYKKLKPIEPETPSEQLFDHLVKSIKQNLELYDYDFKDGSNDMYLDKGHIEACVEILEKFFPEKWKSYKEENKFQIPILF